MADFDDSTDPVLGAACNRLAAFTLPIADGALVDEASGLTETDLITILTALYRMRKWVAIREMTMEQMAREYGPAAIRAQGMEDADLLRAFQATTGEPGDVEADALLAEIERRNLDI